MVDDNNHDFERRVLDDDFAKHELLVNRKAEAAFLKNQTVESARLFSRTLRLAATPIDHQSAIEEARALCDPFAPGADDITKAVNTYKKAESCELFSELDYAALILVAGWRVEVDDRKMSIAAAITLGALCAEWQLAKRNRKHALANRAMNKARVEDSTGAWRKQQEKRTAVAETRNLEIISALEAITRTNPSLRGAGRRDAIRKRLGKTRLDEGYSDSTLKTVLKGR